MATANSLINSRLFLHCEDRSPSAFLSLVQQVEFQILNPSLSFTWCLHGNVWETELLDPVLRLFLYPYPLPYSFAFPLIKVPASWLGFLRVFYLGLKAVSSCNAKISLEKCSCGWACRLMCLCHQHKNVSGRAQRDQRRWKTRGKDPGLQCEAKPTHLTQICGEKPSVSVTTFWGFVLCTIVVAKANALKM